MNICCPGMFREDEVAARFKVSLRTVQERASARQIGHKLGRVRWFTEPEILMLMKAGPECSYSRNAKLAVLVCPRHPLRTKRLRNYKDARQSRRSKI